MTSMTAKSHNLKETLNLPPVSLDEEDALIHARITNDERPLRRVTKKFHTYASVAYPPVVETASVPVEEAREAFLIELASFHLHLRKSRMVCDAERRQVGGYKQEYLRIAHERATLKNEIDELKLALEQAQLERRRKIEYDQIAEKINALPTREEAELSNSALENDIQVIKDEHETQDRSILARKSTLGAIVVDIEQLRLVGKEAPKVDADASPAPSEPPEAEAELGAPGSDMEVDVTEEVVSTSGEGEKHTGEEAKGGLPLNPVVKVFPPRSSTPLLQTAVRQLRAHNSASGLSNSGITPSVSREATPAFTPIGGPDSSPLSPVDSPSPATEEDQREEGEEAEEGEEVEEVEEEEGEEAEDVEMGELSEEKSGGKGKKVAEDREEGEASDESSVLSEPPEE